MNNTIFWFFLDYTHKVIAFLKLPQYYKLQDKLPYWQLLSL